MNLQTILDNRKQREAIDNCLEGIYSAILSAEIDYAKTLTDKQRKTYDRIQGEVFKSERPFGQKHLNHYVSWSFHLNTDDDALQIEESGIDAEGYIDTQSGRFHDPIFIPAELIEAYGTDQWQAALASHMAERWAKFETIIAKETRAAKRAKREADKNREQAERATYERLRTKFEGASNETQ